MIAVVRAPGKEAVESSWDIAIDRLEEHRNRGHAARRLHGQAHAGPGQYNSLRAEK